LGDEYKSTKKSTCSIGCLKDNSQLRAVRGDGISNWEIKRLIKATNGFIMLLNAERKRWKIFQYLEALKN